jgi:hypothetical protein
MGETMKGNGDRGKENGRKLENESEMNVIKEKKLQK